MDRLKQRIATAERALANLEELATKPSLTPVERDAAIQRFEYTFEAVWKAVQLHLREGEGMEIASPKGVARASLQVGLLDEGEVENALAMADDRNLTAHTYDEKLAAEIASRLPKHALLLRRWLNAVAPRAASGNAKG